MNGNMAHGDMQIETDAREHPGRIPGERDIWFFVATDLSIFTLFFITFFIYRLGNPAQFTEAATHLNQGIGLFNTLLLLTSSWLVAEAVACAQRAQLRQARLRLLSAIACGVGFIAIKIFEYAEKIRAGIAIDSSDFFALYFGFTGIHLMHVLAGCGVLLFLSSHLRCHDQPLSTRVRNLESGATFWHLVDLLWIVLFALFYLIA